jgi:hypothetical protein
MNNKKYLIVFIILVAVVVGAIFFIQKNSKPTVENSTVKNSADAIIPQKMVEAPAPSSWNDIKVRTKDIKDLIAQKINQDSKNVNATIAYEDETFADGVFTVSSDSVSTSTNLFLAMNNNNVWQILWTGTDNFPCSIVNQYKMPARITKDCK